MELEGEVISIIYKNDVNSYTIAEFETEDDMLTIVGYLPFISIGDSLKIIGKFVEHKDYGMQFKIDTFEKALTAIANRRLVPITSSIENAFFSPKFSITEIEFANIL